MARIAVVTSSFPSGPGDASGHFVRSEAEALGAAGHQVVVLAPGRRPSVPEHPARGVTVERLGELGAFGPPGMLARLRQNPRRAASVATFCVRVRERLGAAGFARVVAHWLVPSGLVCMLGRLPLEVVAHGSDLELLLGAPTPLGRLLLKRLRNTRATLRLMSEQQLERLRERFGEQALPPHYVRPCAIDVGGALLPQALAALPRGVPVIAIVSRLVASKRVEVALTAATAVPSAEVFVAGDGPLRADLERAFPRAHFLGQLPRPEALGLIARANLLVHASTLEGAATVVREARALGTKVVAAASGDLLKQAQTDPGLHVVSHRQSA